MPVTARLLQRLHQMLGDDATNDLLAWWEEAATVNRVAVREVADLYYARFGDLLEKGLAELGRELEDKIAGLRTELHGEIGELRTELRGEIGELRTELHGEIGKLRTELHGEIGKLRTDLAAQRADLIKWMFLFWAGTVLPLAGLMVALLKL